MKKQGKKHYIDALAGMLTFGVFAVCILSVLLAGAGVYKRLTARDALAYTQRGCAQYVATKLRQADGVGAVSLLPFGDGDALRISQEINGRDYVTYVYCSGGWLRELFADAGESFTPEAGEKLLELDALELRMDGALVTARFTDGGRDTSLRIKVRAGGEQP